MKTYVFEDIDIGGGWRAMVAVGFPESGTPVIVGYMAVNETHDKYEDMLGGGESAYERCGDWLEANKGNIPTLHASQMRKIRGRRALVKAVEEFDPALGAQTRDVALRAVVDENRRPLTVQELASKLFPELACDGTNNDSPDADWRDRG